MTDPFVAAGRGGQPWSPLPRYQPGQVPASSPPAQLGGDARHPLDPDVRTSSRAGAVLLLGIAAIMMMFCVGGVVPAILGLALARGARADLAQARGFLRGDGMLRTGVAMCWTALVTSLLIVFVALVAALVWYGQGDASRFGENVD